MGLPEEVPTRSRRGCAAARARPGLADPAAVAVVRSAAETADHPSHAAAREILAAWTRETAGAAPPARGRPTFEPETT